jgi:hypothetical protein
MPTFSGVLINPTDKISTVEFFNSLVIIFLLAAKPLYSLTLEKLSPPRRLCSAGILPA